MFSTKEREPLIRDEFEDRLYAFCGGIARELRGTLIAAGGMPDHVHLLMRCAADVSLAELVREVKSRSSKWLHQDIDGMKSFAWQRGYGGFSVSRSVLDEVERYVRGQKQHHKVMSFRDEFLALLSKHEIEFDARYVFE
ncbi:MAG: IS200/IS605 family transposase [Phycisphaerales bacterium]|nr:IS200/IS605 family transposase [Phycisphaerales bacterium]